MESLLGGTLQGYHNEALKKAEEERKKIEAQSQRGGLLGISQGMGVGGQSTGGSATTEGGDPDYLGMAKKGLSAYDKSAGTNYSGYLGAAMTFGKFMDWSFDKDATGGGIGRRNIHILEDGFRKGVKDPLKEVPGVKPVLKKAGDVASDAWKPIGNIGSSIGNFFSKLF